MIDKFSTIFDGLRLAFGTFKIEDRNSKGKATGKAMIVREDSGLKKRGKPTLMARSLSGSFRSTKTTCAAGVVSTLTNTTSTTPH